MENINESPEELKSFIRERRTQEGNFEALLQRLDEEIRQEKGARQQTLQDVRDKEAVAYQNLKEKSGSAWPEFEKFVTAFERAIL